MERPIKLPGRDHPIIIEPNPARVVVSVAGRVIADTRSVNAVWTYEAPYDTVAAIRDHLAFYPDRVDAIEERRTA
jgi:uncharacterized protein (DUF427 family)